MLIVNSYRNCSFITDESNCDESQLYIVTNCRSANIACCRLEAVCSSFVQLGSFPLLLHKEFGYTFAKVPRELNSELTPVTV